ncbi:unnamed protein product [Victoria cruziana]
MFQVGERRSSKKFAPKWKQDYWK